MNILLFDRDQVLDEEGRGASASDPTGRQYEFIVKFERSKHHRQFDQIVRQIKTRPSPTFRLGLIGGPSGEGTLHESHESEPTEQTEFLLRVKCLSHPPPPKIPVTIVLALPRPKNLRRCLRAIANFGVTGIHVIHSEHVEKSYWDSPLVTEESCRASLQEGLEVASDTVFPNLSMHRLFRPFAEDVAPHLPSEAKWVADPSSRSEPVTASNGPTDRPFVYAIGPESGFNRFEIALLQKAGFNSLGLGVRILTVENAISAVCSRHSVLS